MSDLSLLWKVHIFLLLAVYQTAVFLLMGSEMGFIICQLVNRCSRDNQIDHKDELNTSTNVGGQLLQTVSLSCSGPSIFHSFAVINCPRMLQEKRKTCVCVCVCRQVCFYLEKHYSIQDKNMTKTESVLKCLCCKPVYNAIREGTFNVAGNFFFLTKRNRYHAEL